MDIFHELFLVLNALPPPMNFTCKLVKRPFNFSFLTAFNLVDYYISLSRFALPFAFWDRGRDFVSIYNLSITFDVAW